MTAFHFFSSDGISYHIERWISFTVNSYCLWPTLACVTEVRAEEIDLGNGNKVSR